MVHLPGVLWNEPVRRSGHLEMVFMWAGFAYIVQAARTSWL